MTKAIRTRKWTRRTNSLSAALTVYNNGYKGKRWTGGGDIATVSAHEGCYAVKHSSGSSTYCPVGWTGSSCSWTSVDLPVPASASVISARLYQAYASDQTAGGGPRWTMIFNGSVVERTAIYTDRRGYGSGDYPQGMIVYDVTSLFRAAGNSMAMTPLSGNSNNLFGASLIVVHAEPGAPLRKIWINEECDLLCAGSANSVSDDEATAYASFSGIVPAAVRKAKATAILAGAGDSGKSGFIFNGVEHQGFWPGFNSASQIGFSTYDVTSALTASGNEAGLRSVVVDGAGDCMAALGVILVADMKATAQVVLSNLSYVYDGSPKAVACATEPAGLRVVVTYDGASTAPTNAGVYGVVAVVDDGDYRGVATDSLVIAKAGQVIMFGAMHEMTYGDPDFDPGARGELRDAGRLPKLQRVCRRRGRWQSAVSSVRVCL